MSDIRLTKWSQALGLPQLTPEVLEEASASYGRLKKECFTFLVQTDGVDLNKFNPLSKVSVGNPWASQYDNQSKLDEIKLDVDRTYQEIPFFADNPEHHKSLINVLFVFTKTHKIGYRQGMNEICAIFFHLCRDESLTYLLFTNLLLNLEHNDMFQNNLAPNSQQSFILVRCEGIFKQLEVSDPKLFKHLIQNDVSPNLFLVRWIRLLFSREFSFQNIFHIWDWLFSSSSLEVNINAFALAMIIHIRTELLASDNSGCFMKLLKYDESKIDSLFSLANRLVGNDIPVQQQINSITSLPQSRDISVDLRETIEKLRDKNLPEIQSEISKLESILTRLNK